MTRTVEAEDITLIANDVGGYAVTVAHDPHGYQLLPAFDETGRYHVLYYTDGPEISSIYSPDNDPAWSIERDGPTEIAAVLAWMKANPDLDD